MTHSGDIPEGERALNESENAYDVTFPYGTRFRYALPLYLLIAAVCSILNMYYEISIFVLVLATLIFLPMILISLRSRIKKHKLQMLENEIVLGSTRIGRETLRKIEICKPSAITFFLDKTKAGNGKSAETIHVNPENAESVTAQIKLWADQNKIKLDVIR